MSAAHAKAVEDLPGLGPASKAMLALAGVHNLAQLQALGSVAVFVAARRANPGRASLNLLWGLEAALTGQSWQVVAREERTRLLLAVEDWERAHPVDAAR